MERVNFIRCSLKKMVEDYKKDSDVTHILVFMDESYIHTTHFDKKGFYRKGPAGENNHTSSKGRRLIMMHAIMRDRPLCERDAKGRPVDDLRSTSSDCPNAKETNTPYPLTPGHPLSPNMSDPSPNALRTCETLWVTNSETGDYHDNMNSKMFMQWVSEWLLPTLK